MNPVPTQKPKLNEWRLLTDAPNRTNDRKVVVYGMAGLSEFALLADIYSSKSRAAPFGTRGINGPGPLYLINCRLIGHCEQQMLALAKASFPDKIQHCFGVGADLLGRIT